jgi:hypothetical protein
MFVTFPIETGDRRQHPRKEVSLRGGLNFGRTAPQRSCTIKNISRGGARLHVGLLIGLPDRFGLLISPVKTIHRECQLVWSSEFEVGIKFV